MSPREKAGTPLNQAVQHLRARLFTHLVLDSVFIPVYVCLCVCLGKRGGGDPTISKWQVVHLKADVTLNHLEHRLLFSNWFGHI